MVYVEVPMCVFAASEEDAERIAIDNMAEEAHNAQAEADEVTRHGILLGWSDCYPWGGDGSKTCGQIFGELYPSHSDYERQ